jgi:hypothetical protein
MKKLSYSAKVGIVKNLLPLAIIIPCAIIGYHSISKLFAASPPLNGLSIVASKNIYRVGDTVAVTIANGTNVNLFIVNNCPKPPFSVYRLAVKTTVNLAPNKNPADCQNAPDTYSVPAGRSITTSYGDWPTLFATPGLYRIDFTPEYYSQSVSTQFSVIN